jgi:hypothetical protein
MDPVMRQTDKTSRRPARATVTALAALMAIATAACTTSAPVDIRTGPQAVHPGDLARGVANAPVGSTISAGPTSAGTSVAELFRAICEANEPDFANAVSAAVATGAFGPPQTTSTGFGSPRTSLMSPDGRVETVIVVATPNDPGGSSCGVGTIDGSELYVILPTGSLRPA